MSKFTVGDNVQVKFTSLQGQVSGAALDNTTLELQYLVDYTDTTGEQQSRYFKESDLEATV